MSCPGERFTPDEYLELALRELRWLRQLLQHVRHRDEAADLCPTVEQRQEWEQFSQSLIDALLVERCRWLRN